MKFLEFYTKYFAVWVVLGGILAYFFPGPFLFFKSFNKLFFALTMFGIGAVLSVDDFKQIAKRPVVVLIGVTTQFTVMPLGALLGVPFPAGMVLVSETAPGLAPWAWAVNGCASVVSAVLAALVALTWGFSTVLWGAALAYGLALVAVWALLVGPRERHKADTTPVAS